MFFRKRLSGIQWLIAAYFLGGGWLWSLTFGNIRFAAFLIYTGGILLAFLFELRPAGKTASAVYRGVCFGVILFLSLHNLRVITHVFRASGLLRSGPGQYFSQLRYLSEKRLSLPPSAAANLKDAEIVLNCRLPSLGYSILSELRGKPAVLLTDDYAGFFKSQAYADRAFARISDQKIPGGMTRFAAIVPAESHGFISCEENVKSSGGIMDKEFFGTVFLERILRVSSSSSAGFRNRNKTGFRSIISGWRL